MKKKCLIVFKWPIDLHSFIINKFSKFYDTEYIYLNKFKEQTYSEIIDEINKLIQSKNCEIVFFDVDSIKLINFFFINKIKNVKKILMTFDDTTVHEMNSITASACDLVITHCPSSALKYKEKGYEAHNMFLENDVNIFKNYNLKKDIDVLFFGRINSTRREFLNFIEKSEINIKIVGGNENFIPLNELSKLISKSKIVLNLSKTTKDSVSNFSIGNIYNFYYELKGRVIIAGLCGTLCVSEYFPDHEIMFKENELPIFYTKEECIKILKKLLYDSEMLQKNTEKFCFKILNSYEENKNFQPIYNAIEKINSNKVKLIKFPYWYLRIVAKQIIKRNINIKTFFKTISQFKQILEILKNSSLYIKFLILIETFINIFWYSLLPIIKSKK